MATAILEDCISCGIPHGEPKDLECPGLMAANPDYGKPFDSEEAIQTMDAMKRRILALEEVSRESVAVRRLLKKKAQDVMAGRESTSPSSSSDESSESSESETSAYSHGKRSGRAKKKGRSSRRRKSKSSKLKSSRFSHHRHLG